MRIRSRHVLSVVLLLTAVLALLPTRWLGWTADVADIVRIPIVPIANIGNRVYSALRPVQVLRVGPQSDYGVLEVEGQRDRLERLLRAEQLKNQSLSTQLRQLQDLPPAAGASSPPILLETDITGRRPDHPISGVELHLTNELSGRIKRGDALTWDGRWLMGRVTRVSDLRISALPVTHPDIGPLMGRVIGPDEDVTQAPSVRLRQDGLGGFLAEVDRRSGVSIGDEVILEDRSWSPALQAFHLGRVREITDVDEAPLRYRLHIVPEVHLHELPWVVIVGVAVPTAAEADQ